MSADATEGHAARELAHEFRNLLAEIASYRELIDDESNDWAALKANLLEIRTAAERAQALADGILHAAFGYGPLDPLMHDRSVSEIMVNGPDQVFIERRGVLSKSEARFDDENHLMETIRGLLATTGRYIDGMNPMVEARLPDGSRVNAIIRPASTHGPTLTIRKFTDAVISIDDLIREGSLSPAMAEFLKAAVLGRMNIFVSGGTGSGKTTTLNVIAGLIPHNQHVVTIENAAELQLDHPNVISLEQRPPNADGDGELTIRQLLLNSPRMRPDRILVGEVRGGEAFDVVQAMNGHDGSMSTIESNSARDAVARLEIMMTASSDIPIEAARAQIASGVNLIVHHARMHNGRRKIVQIAEVVGYDRNGVILREIFQLGMGADMRLEYNATGYMPASLDKAAYYGVQVDQGLFDPVKSRFVPAGSDSMVPAQSAAGRPGGTNESAVRQVVVVPFSSDRPAPAMTPEMQEEMRKLIDAARAAVGDLKKAADPAAAPPKPPTQSVFSRMWGWLGHRLGRG